MSAVKQEPDYLTEYAVLLRVQQLQRSLVVELNELIDGKVFKKFRIFTDFVFC